MAKKESTPGVKESRERVPKENRPKTKRAPGEKRDLTTLMNVLTAVVMVVVCVGLTVWNIILQYPDGVRKIDGTFTAAVFTDIVAFAFLGGLIMFGVRKLVLKK